MRKIITSVILTTLLLTLSWYIPHAFVEGLGPIIFSIIFVLEGILLGYTILVIKKVTSKKIRWLFVFILAGSFIAIYISWKYFPSQLQGMPRRYFDVQSS
jgi:hypothetical protein